MKLEQQVVSLELAEKLKELGVGQESMFYWSYEVDVEDTYFLGPKHNGFNLLCSAFTVAELFKICFDQGIEYRIEETMQAEHIADHLAERICKTLSSL